MKVLKFSATWCGPCKQLSSVLSTIPTAPSITEVDVDSNVGSEMAVKFGIRGVPTMVVLDDTDKEIGRRTGSGTAADLIEWFGSMTKNGQ